MKKIFLFIISIGLLSLVSCEKEEAPINPTTNSANSGVDFGYDNTTVEGVLEAAGYNSAEVTYSERNFGVWGLYDGHDENDIITCIGYEYLCFVVIEPKGKGTDKDIIIAAPETPVVVRGDYKLKSDENGTKTYQIITNN